VRSKNYRIGSIVQYCLVLCLSVFTLFFFVSLYIFVK